MDVDPRDEVPVDPHDVLTEDSEDELADLEKEFAARKARLLEEREMKKKRSLEALQVQRSPSPKRSTRAQGKETVLPAFKGRKLVFTDKGCVIPPTKAFQKTSTSTFASKLRDIQQTQHTDVTNYKERFFEFENITSKSIINCTDADSKDLHSGEILLRRYLSSAALDQNLASVKILRVAKLLAKVHAPQFEEPKYINWCLAGIIMHKSEPKTTTTNSKYMCLRIGLFTHTVDVFLFGDAFRKYWKLQCGDVVAVLNPGVKKYGDRFNLSLKDNLNAVLEIGTLKHYKRCSADTAQGERCKFIVDSLKNDLCSYHEERKFKQRSRMELQGSIKQKAPRDKNGNVSQFYISNTNKTLFVGYESAGILEKDVVYTGGEQFDESKFDRPVVDSAAAKVRNQMANNRLESQLLTRSAPTRTAELQRLGIVCANAMDGSKLNHEQLRMQAFHHGFLKGIGYDPVAAAGANQLIHDKRPANSKAIEDLRMLGSCKSVNIAPSTEERAAKARRRKQAMRILKSSACEPQLLAAIRTQTPKQNTVIAKVEDVSCDDESDIEISFASEADKIQYANACLQSKQPILSENVP